MSLVLLWMPNGSLHNFLTEQDAALGVEPRLQFVGPLNATYFLVL